MARAWWNVMGTEQDFFSDMKVSLHIAAGSFGDSSLKLVLRFKAIYDLITTDIFDFTGLRRL